MSERVCHILKRMDSRFFARLWTFYRDYFSDDNDCLDFLYSMLKNTPEETGEIYHEKEGEKGVFQSDSGKVYREKDLIPRRMLFSIERFVTIARNMENVRRGEDIFKLVYLVTCVETLQTLRGKKVWGKRKMLFDFFDNYTSDGDKKYISGRFSSCYSDFCPNEDSFALFISALNELRNSALHEGEFYDFFFNNSSDQTLLSVFVKYDLTEKAKKPTVIKKLKQDLVKSLGIKDSEEAENFMKEFEADPTLVYETALSYWDFEKIFIKTSIAFIRQYVAAQEAKNNVGT